MVTPKDFIHGHYNGLSCICRFDIKCHLLFNYIALPKTTKQLATQRNSDCLMRVSFLFYLFFRFSFSFSHQQPEKIHLRFFTRFRLLANGQKGRWPQRYHYVSSLRCSLFMRVPNRFLAIRDFPYLKLGIRIGESGLKSKIGQDSRLKVCARVRMPEMTLEITRLHEILGRNYGIEEPY